MPRSVLARLLAALVWAAALFSADAALADTIGALPGTVVEQKTRHPVAGASVSSPSQIAKTTTDASGRFTLISLAPDTLVDADGHAILRKLPASHGAYLVRLNAPVELAPGAPLRVTVDVARIAADGERFDLAGKKPNGWRSVTVDGARVPPYTDAYR
jgi:hypothetical protein